MVNDAANKQNTNETGKQHMWTTNTLKHVQQKETNMQPSTRIKRKGRFFDLEPNAKSDVSFFLQRYLAKRTFQSR